MTIDPHVLLLGLLVLAVLVGAIQITCVLALFVLARDAIEKLQSRGLTGLAQPAHGPTVTNFQPPPTITTQKTTLGPPPGAGKFRIMTVGGATVEVGLLEALPGDKIRCQRTDSLQQYCTSLDRVHPQDRAKVQQLLKTAGTTDTAWTIKCGDAPAPSKRKQETPTQQDATHADNVCGDSGRAPACDVKTSGVLPPSLGS